MKVLDLPKPKLYLSIKPVYLMGFVILGVSIFAFLFALWTLVFEDYLFLWFIPTPEVNNWGVLIAALVAMIGWLVTSIITTRNSVKQYTITMLLQSRLSSEYIKHATAVNNLLIGNKDLKIDLEFINDLENQDVVVSVTYILNYAEFVCSGLRCGDFDNHLLKMTLKGIFSNLYGRCEPYIIECQKTNPKCYEHFTQVIAVWKIK